MEVCRACKPSFQVLDVCAPNSNFILVAVFKVYPLHELLKHMFHCRSRGVTVNFGLQRNIWRIFPPPAAIRDFYAKTIGFGM